MDSQKQQLVEKINASTNILVTVSANPTVDQLAACIGLTLILNKLDKHATAVFSGEVPSTLEFLKPEKTLEKNTDSLRDFIISLDKSKADKLRYKIEDKVVKIFITPYRTSLSSADLNFGQGDFNVDLIMALGVHRQADLDQAIMAHGRILHDAVVSCITNTPNGELGTVNWQDTNSSSLSELVAELAKSFEKEVLDEQIATALLTGIIAETDRFRNEKTSSVTMNHSADLMAAGANQQLVAAKLDQPVQATKPSTGSADALKPTDDLSSEPAESTKETGPKSDDGTLEIRHSSLGEIEQTAVPAPPQSTEPPAKSDFTESPEQAPDLEQAARTSAGPVAQGVDTRSRITDAPSLGGKLTANTNREDETFDLPIEALGASTSPGPLLSHDRGTPSDQHGSTQPTPPSAASGGSDDFFTLPPPSSDTDPFASQPPLMPPTSDGSAAAPFGAPAPSVRGPVLPSVVAPTPPPEPTPAPASTSPAQPTPSAPPTSFNRPVQHETLTELEESVESPHVESSPDPVESARDAVLKALNEQPDSNLPPIEALNAQPVDLGNRHDGPSTDSLPPLPPLPPAPPQAPGFSMPPPVVPTPPEAAPFASSPADQALNMPLPPGLNLPPPQSAPPTDSRNNSPNPPPPVPPPMMPPYPQ